MTISYSFLQQSAGAEQCQPHRSATSYSTTTAERSIATTASYLLTTTTTTTAAARCNA